MLIGLHVDCLPLKGEPKNFLTIELGFRHIAGDHAVLHHQHAVTGADQLLDLR